jgi:hypothetical protein
VVGISGAVCDRLTLVHFSSRPVIKLARLMPKFFEEVIQISVGWLNPGQLLGEVEGGPEISGLAIECDQSHQRVPIGWMPRQALLENGRGVGRATV